MEFKDIIIKLRNEKNIDQQKLAEIIGVSRSTVSMWELGKRFPSKEGYEAISDYFNVDIDYLYGRTNIRQKVHFDGDGTPMYYYDDDARAAAEFLHSNPDYKVLFDATRNVSADDINTVKDIIDHYRKKMTDRGMT